MKYLIEKSTKPRPVNGKDGVVIVSGTRDLMSNQELFYNAISEVVDEIISRNCIVTTTDSMGVDSIVVDVCKEKGVECLVIKCGSLGISNRESVEQRIDGLVNVSYGKELFYPVTVIDYYNSKGSYSGYCVKVLVKKASFTESNNIIKTKRTPVSFSDYGEIKKNIYSGAITSDELKSAINYVYDQPTRVSYNGTNVYAMPESKSDTEHLNEAREHIIKKYMDKIMASKTDTNNF